MAVQACMKPKMMDEIDDNDDDDDVPLVFKRSSTAPKQNQLNSETKKSSSHKHDKQSRNHVSEVHSSNGRNSVSQKGKPILSTKASPMKSHAASPKTPGSSFMASAVKSPSESPIGSTSFAKASPVKSPEVNSKVSTSAADQSRHSSQQNAPSTVKTEKQLINSSGEPHTDCEDSEDDKPLSDRFSAALPKGNPNHANKGSNTSNLGSPPLQKPGVKYEDSDDEMPLSSRFQLNPNVGPSSLGSPPLKKFGVKYEDSDDDIPLSSKLQLKPNVGPSSMSSPPLQNSGVKYEDSDDDIPLSSKLQLKPNVGPSSLGSSSLQKSGVKYEDSDDDIPLSSKLQLKPNVGPSSLGSPPLQKSGVKYEDSDDDIPLSSKLQLKPNVGPFSSKSKSYEFDENKPMLPKPQQNGSTKNDNQINISPTVLNKRSRGDFLSQSSFERPKLVEGSSKQVSVKVESKVDDDDDFVPLSQRLKNSSLSAYKSVCAREKLKKVVPSSFKKTSKKFKKVVKHSKYSKSSKLPPGSGEGQKWTTLVHNGVIFPPAYKPHGVKMLCKGQPVDLTPEQEEVATMFAVMLDTEYINKPKFKENFMNDWRKILGKNHVIQRLEDCDFSPIYVWHQREKEKKKQMSAEEKKALKEEKLKQEEKYMWAVVNGVKEKVGNFRVEPPGLFRGRGEHPKMGKLKKRIRPSDIAINIGKGAPIPECPIPGERWKEIRHDNTVTWLAYWNDPINPKEFKYVFLAASSSLKGQSDKEKYEKARLLKDYIQGIRTAYTKDFASKDITRRQIAVATYLIDKLALRAGNEKDDDEADTVGCCTLKVENVEPMPPNILKFDFLGKDSIRYQNEVEVELPVFKAIQQFRTGKSGGDDLFDKLDTSKLNAHLKELMPGLTAKVFRTYNASITLDEMLSRETEGGDVTEKVVVYQHANKEVAIICNHQRTVSKSHSAQMSRLNEKIEELKGILDGLKTDLAWAKKGKPQLKSADGKPGKNLNPEALERKIVQTNAKIEKMERDKKTKEDLKTVALGTSKINYLDPRITVAWCKRHEVPIEKVGNKMSLAYYTLLCRSSTSLFWQSLLGQWTLIPASDSEVLVVISSTEHSFP